MVQSMVKRFSVGGIRKRVFVTFLLLQAMVSLHLTGPAFAGDTGHRTEIEADRLETNSADRYAEFIGNVKATQGNHQLSSDKLRIYYEGDVSSFSQATPAVADDLQIRKIVAYGNVQIVSEEYTIVTSQAEYEVATQIMTLTGVNSKVTQGKNTLVGSKITVYQAEGRIQVDGQNGKRVKVTFFPEGDEADLLKGPVQKPGQ
jgi:lipopolysaccharide export system protein LptA